MSFRMSAKTIDHAALATGSVTSAMIPVTRNSASAKAATPTAIPRSDGRAPTLRRAAFAPSRMAATPSHAQPADGDDASPITTEYVRTSAASATSAA